MKNILNLCTVLIYIVQALDVNSSPVVLVFNILGTEE